MKKTILTAGLVLAGCATTGFGAATPKCYQYPGQDFKICEANPTFVNEVCDQGELSDAGYMITNPKKFYGCADRANKVAWVAWDAPQPETTIHELCHMLDNPTEDCERIRPVRYDFAGQQLLAMSAPR